MRVLKLECNNFRNIENEILIPCEGMNVIYGENAQGKTNLLEAIWLFTGAKSFRNNKDSAFINFGKEYSCCKLDFLSSGIEKNAKIEIIERRTAYLNQNKLKSPSLLAGSFNAVVFSPNDLGLIKDGPAVRRKFLDIAIGQLYPSYIEILRNYIRAITQRNRVIKDFKYDSSLSFLLDSFEEEIAQNGSKIIEIRCKYLDRLKNYLPIVYDGLSNGREILQTDYVCSCRAEELRELLEKNRSEDMYSGITSVGPHRDDISFKINEIDVRLYGSQGQKRSVALSLKLAEAEIIKNVVGEWPIFLLDDVMSELDPSRQGFILNHIKNMQTFLTCCEPLTVGRLETGKSFKISKGRVI